MPPRVRSAALVLLGALLTWALVLGWRGCAGELEGRHELQLRRALLEREVKGLREVVAAGGNGLAIPNDDVAIAIEDRLVRDLVAVQLPIEADVERAHVRLKDVDVQFRGRPLVSLRGSGFLRERPGIAAALEVQGALVDMRVDPARGTLRARIAIDGITVERAAGLESLLGERARHELEHTLRRRLEGLLPTLEIPVKVQQTVTVPAVTTGPVRLEAAAMPLEVAVSRVFAGHGRLWVAVRVRAGELERAASPAPPGAKP